jgi:23S rRNA A1618 N6-methylase RlmF
MLRVRREKRARKKRNGRQKAAAPSRDSIKRKKDLELRRDVVTTAIENAELRMETIDAAFCKPGFFAETDDTKIRAMQTERDRLAAELEEHMAEWERIEEQLSTSES